MFVIFLNTNGKVKSFQKISGSTGGLTAAIASEDMFGVSCAGVADLDQDGTSDIVVGSLGHDTTANADTGAVYLIFLSSDGMALSHVKVTTASNGFTGTLEATDYFGRSLCNLGDLDGNNRTDLAVGASRDDDGAIDAGAVYILFLDSAGSAVVSHQKISTTGSLTANLNGENYFGISLGNMGDLNSDGIADIAVGAYQDDSGGSPVGTLYLVFLSTTGTPTSHQKISTSTTSLFTGVLGSGDRFGISSSTIGDLNLDGIADLVIGANGDNDGVNGTGAIYVIFGSGGNVCDVLLDLFFL